MDFIELKNHLESTRHKLDITEVHDKSGYSPIHYASYKNMF